MICLDKSDGMQIDSYLCVGFSSIEVNKIHGENKVFALILSSNSHFDKQIHILEDLDSV